MEQSLLGIGGSDGDGGDLSRIAVLRRLCAEFVGTFVIVLTTGSCLLSPSSSVWRPLATAMVVGAMTYSTVRVSGGHLNPAVTLSLTVARREHQKPDVWLLAVLYCVTQIVAGVVAGCCLCAVLHPRSAAVEPIAPFGLEHAVLAEGMYSFLVCLVFCGLQVLRREAPSSEEDADRLLALSVGCATAAGADATFGISGACINPAVAIGYAWTGAGLRWCPWWLAGQLAGGFLAAAVVSALRRAAAALRTPPFGRRRLEPERPAVPHLIVRCAGDFLGTFVLVFTASLCTVMRSTSAALSTAASFLCVSCALGGVSSGFFNPALTLGAACSGFGLCSAGEALAFSAFQIFGGLCAGRLTALFHAASPYSRTTYGLTVGPGFLTPGAVVSELIFTFALVYVTLACLARADLGRDRRAGRSDSAAAASAACLFAGLCASGAASGGQLNPALCAGIVAEDVDLRGTYTAASNFFAFSVWELLGGLLAACAVRASHAGQPLEKAPLLSK